MPQFAISTESIDIPEGYSTYSVLLIPDPKWFQKLGFESVYRFFNHFKQLGNLIGSRHLACWFCHTSSQTYMVDYKIIATIGNYIESSQELEDYLNKKFSKNKVFMSQTGYDVKRARLICASLSLPYSQGPYVAFFGSKPSLPYWGLSQEPGLYREEYIGGGEKVSTPDFVLKFGGLNLDRSLVLLDSLEAHLLRDEIQPKKMKLGELMLHIEQWCSQNQEFVAEVLRGIIAIAVKDIPDEPSDI